jgi:hypothetical protein
MSIPVNILISYGAWDILWNATMRKQQGYCYLHYCYGL